MIHGGPTGWRRAGVGPPTVRVSAAPFWASQPAASMPPGRREKGKWSVPWTRVRVTLVPKCNRRFHLFPRPRLLYLGFLLCFLTVFLDMLSRRQRLMLDTGIPSEMALFKSLSLSSIHFSVLTATPKLPKLLLAGFIKAAVQPLFKPPVGYDECARVRSGD